MGEIFWISGPWRPLIPIGWYLLSDWLLSFIYSKRLKIISKSRWADKLRDDRKMVLGAKNLQCRYQFEVWARACSKTVVWQKRHSCHIAPRIQQRSYLSGLGQAYKMARHCLPLLRWRAYWTIEDPGTFDLLISVLLRCTRWIEHCCVPEIWFCSAEQALAKQF